MSWLDSTLERTARRAARRISRRSFLARLGVALVGGAALPLLPVSRVRAEADAGSGAGALGLSQHIYNTFVHILPQ